MFIAFVILGMLGGSVAAAVAVASDSSLMLTLLSFSLSGTLTAVVASGVFVILLRDRAWQDGEQIIEQG